MACWYVRLKPPRSRADRERVARKSPRPIPQRVRKPPRIRNPKHVFYKTYSTSVHLNGYRAFVITRWGIAKLFDVHPVTVHKWAAQGVLPEPFMYSERGELEVPLYLSAQIRCLMIVMTDLVADGYTSIPWHKLGEHLTMLHEGYDEAARNFSRRLTGNVYEQSGGRKGVAFDD